MQAEPKEIDPGSVRFATVVDDEHGFHRNFFRSWLPLFALDLSNQQRIWRGGYMIQGATSAGIVEGRNQIVRDFLPTNAEWLFMVDSDMGFEADALEQLMAVADPVNRPIVGGLCFGFGPISDVLDHAQAEYKMPFPTIFDLRETEDDAGFRPRWAYVPGELQNCDATGGAFIVIHRSVLEAIVDKWGEVWFDRIKHPKSKKGAWGEDTSFCARARLLGFQVHVHTGVKTSHAKTIHVTETTYMRHLVAEPADAPTAVLVPVLNRPQNAEPFMRSLRASTGLAEVYALVEESDVACQEAWRDAGASLIVTNAHTFAEKINVGYQNTEEPWIFLVGDDVRFHPGWLDHAQAVARNTGAKVVGTNDLGNDRVMRGEHATHILIARDYIDEQGASWDGPGVVCHEGYRHWYVDDELVTAAKQRNTFAPALASIVEHLHPLWGKADDDEVYRLAQKSVGKDKIAFARRSREHAA